MFAVVATSTDDLMSRPLIRLSTYCLVAAWRALVGSAARLICAHEGVAPLWIDCGSENTTLPVAPDTMTWLAVPATDSTPVLANVGLPATPSALLTLRPAPTAMLRAATVPTPVLT
ncbi:hypothetical protein D3C80_1635640 [compost metagenome]